MKKRFLCILLIVSFILSFSLNIYAASFENGDSELTTQELNEFRKLFFTTDDGINFKSRSFDDNDEELIIVDKENIIHRPFKPIEFVPADEYRIEPFILFQESYNLNHERMFYIDIGRGSGVPVKGKNVATGTHSNVWLVDDYDFHRQTNTTHSDSTCSLVTLMNTNTLSQSIATNFDNIYACMTDPQTGFGEHSQIRTNFANCPYVGDIDNDGKINILLYDIENDGTSSSGYTAGFFDSADYNPRLSYSNKLDVFHIDVGLNQGFYLLNNDSISNKANFYGTLSHEFQHLLFFTHTAAKDNLANDFLEQTIWINEALSGYADIFYTIPNSIVFANHILQYSVLNDYGNKTGAFGSNSDFLRFNNSFKNYAIGYMFSAFSNNCFNRRFPRAVYSAFDKETTLYNKDIRNILGGVINTLSGRNFDNAKAFQAYYYLFMETMAADGGSVNIYENGQPTHYTTTKLTKGITLDNNNRYKNLWYTRKNFPLNQSLYYPTLNNGDNISLDVYNSTNKINDVTLEKTYILGGTPKEYLSVSYDANYNNVILYVLVPRDNVEEGADVYEVESGKPLNVHTNGKNAYLFASTYGQKAEGIPLNFLWSDSSSDAKPPVITKQPESLDLLKGEAALLTVEASGSTNNSLSYQWYVNSENKSTGAEEIYNAKQSSYIPPTNELGTKYYFCTITNIDNTAQGNKQTSISSNIAYVSVTLEKVSQVLTNIEPGQITAGSLITLSTETPGAVIRYTLDNTTPTPESQLYNQPIEINVNTVIKAIAYKDGMASSDMATFVYSTGRIDGYRIEKGTRAGTIKIVKLNTSDPVYTGNRLEYALTTNVNDTKLTKWKPFKKVKVNFLDNIKTNAGVSLYVRAKKTSKEPASNPELVCEIAVNDIQLLTKPFVSVKTTETGFYGFTNIVFSKEYKDMEYTVSPNTLTELWTDCPLIASDRKNDLIVKSVEIFPEQSLFIRKKRTELLPESVALEKQLVSSSPKPQSILTIEALGNNVYELTLDLKNDETIKSKFQYAFINKEAFDADKSTAVLKAKWRSISKNRFTVKQSLAPGEYYLALRLTKKSKTTASEPVFTSFSVNF